MNIGREKNSQIDEAYYYSENPVITIKDLFPLDASITYCINTQIAVKYMKLKFGVKTNMR
jgi:hypothetical protein